MVNYGNAIKRPFTDFKKLIIGCALNIIPIVNLFSAGYALNCGKTAMAKKKELPEWTNWGDLFVRGLFGLIISVIYFIPTLILLILTLGSGIITILTTKEPLSAIPSMGPLLIITLIVGILTAFILPNGILGYVSKWKFGDAFKLGNIFKKSFRGVYLAAWLFSIIVLLVLGSVFALIPIIGPPIGSFISMVISYTVIGETYTQK